MIWGLLLEYHPLVWTVHIRSPGKLLISEGSTACLAVEPNGELFCCEIGVTLQDEWTDLMSNQLRYFLGEQVPFENRPSFGKCRSLELSTRTMEERRHADTDQETRRNHPHR